MKSSWTNDAISLGSQSINSWIFRSSLAYSFFLFLFFLYLLVFLRVTELVSQSISYSYSWLWPSFSFSVLQLTFSDRYHSLHFKSIIDWEKTIFRSDGVKVPIGRQKMEDRSKQMAGVARMRNRPFSRRRQMDGDPFNAISFEFAEHSLHIKAPLCSIFLQKFTTAEAQSWVLQTEQK